MVSISRGEPGPQARPGRQRPLVQVAHARVAQDGHRVAALQGGHLVQGDAAAQRGRQHAARAGADDQVDVAERFRQAFLHRVQGPGHPGRPHHPARAEHQARPPPGPPPAGLGIPGLLAGAPRHPWRSHAHLLAQPLALLPGQRPGVASLLPLGKP